MDEQKPKEELGENLGDIFKEDFYEEEPIENLQPKSLHKVKKNSLIAGVCTGIAKYFGIEPVIIRVIFVVSIFLGGWGIAAYFLAAILMPSEIIIEENTEEETPEYNYTKTVIGTFFVFTGLFFIADNFGFTENLFFFALPKFLIVPIILIGSGIFILVKINSFKNSKSYTRQNKFYRSENDRRLLGVCGGLGEYLNIESNSLRMLWIVFAFITLGTALVLYFLIAALSKTEKSKIEKDIQLEIQ